MNNSEIVKPMKPFMVFCQKAIPLAFDESLSYLELLSYILNYINKELVPATNSNTEAIVELRDFVIHYFDNLDVQEEINNKLDEMAESGELAEIIAQYLQLNGILAYNTVADMKNAENLVDGSFTKTYGKLTYNDGNGAFYKIRTLTSGDEVDEIHIIALTNYPTLIAELITDNQITSLVESVSTIQDNITEINGNITSLTNKVNSIPYFLKDKKILVIGDSISNEVGVTALNWVKWLRNNFPVDTVDNISYNGALLTGEGGQAKNYADNVTQQYDIIIIALGINDAYHQATLQTLSYSNINYNTFNGALTYLQQQIFSKNPSAHVYYVAPLKNNYDQNNQVFVDVYRSYIFHACNMFGWTFIDAGHGAPILNPYNDGNKVTYMPDGIHPSEAYASILGQYIVNKIASDGDASIGDFQSRMNLTTLLTTDEQNAGSTLYAEFSSKGNVKLVYQCPNTSVGSGIAVVPTNNLPSWCQPYSQKFGQCMIGTHSFLGRVTGSSIQLFPDVTETGGLYFECEIQHSLMVQSMETQI